MKNLWLKKNPAMSMFLSAGKAWMGVIRGQATKAAKRQIAVASKPAASTGKKRGRRAF